MLPARPELSTPDTLSSDLLGVVGFGVPAGHASIPIRQLGPRPQLEIWRSPLPVTRGDCGDVVFSSNGEVLFGAIAADGSATHVATEKLYDQILRSLRSAGYPHLLRVWNHVGGINRCDEGLEHYRQFSVARHDTFARFGYVRGDFPAACAVGMADEGLSIYFIASRTRGAHVENPRQIAAYEYPARYGPRSPSFSRATVAQWDGDTMIFISGTSSVVGHETLHAGDIEAQLEETLRNLEKIICVAATRAGARASLDDLRFAKIYLRRASDYPLASSRVSTSLPNAQALFLESDICRSDLLIEIDGVAWM